MMKFELRIEDNANRVSTSHAESIDDVDVELSDRLGQAIALAFLAHSPSEMNGFLFGLLSGLGRILSPTASLCISRDLYEMAREYEHRRDAEACGGSKKRPVRLKWEFVDDVESDSPQAIGPEDRD